MLWKLPNLLQADGVTFYLCMSSSQAKIWLTSCLVPGEYVTSELRRTCLIRGLNSSRWPHLYRLFHQKMFAYMPSSSTQARPCPGHSPPRPAFSPLSHVQVWLCQRPISGPATATFSSLFISAPHWERARHCAAAGPCSLVSQRALAEPVGRWYL